MSNGSPPQRSKGHSRKTTVKHDTLGKLFGDHVKQADTGTRAATLDVAIPFIQAMKKSHHDFMLRCKMELNMSAEQRMQNEMLPMPMVKDTTPCSFLFKNKNLTSTMHQSVKKLKEFTHSQDALLYIVSKEREQIFLCPKYVHSISHMVNFKIEPESTLAAYVAHSKEYVVTEDVLKDPRFPLGLGYLGICNEAAMGVPVQTSSGEIIAVIELSKRAEQGTYRKKDELAAVCLAKWIGASVGITTEIQMFVGRHQFFNYITHVITYYTSVGGDFPFENILSHIMTFCEQFLRAHEGRLYVLTQEEEYGNLRYDLNMFARPQGSKMFVKTNTSVLGVTKSVAQTVLRNGKGLNLHGCQVSEYEKWFDDDIVQCIICEPIFGKFSKTAGAIEFFNKYEGIKFTEEDQKILCSLAHHFSIFLSYYSRCLEKKRLKAKVGLYTEMLCNHLKPGEATLQKMNEDIQIPDDLFSYTFFPKDLSIEYLAKLSTIIFTRTLGICHFPDLDIPLFLITLAKSYDNRPPFTNFLHAFTVLHCTSVIITNHRELFTKSQQEYMLLAALFHGFGLGSLKVKYSKGFNFASFLTHYTAVFFKAFKFTDKMRTFWVNMLTKAFSERNHRIFHSGLCKFILKDMFNWDNDVHRFYAMALIMRVAEDAMWYKPFHITAFMSRNLLKQMQQEQIDLAEKLMNLSGRKNRKKNVNIITGREFIAKQINDIRTKCMPNIEILGYLLPGSQPLLNLACHTVQQWEIIARSTECNIWESETSWPKKTPSETNLYFSPIDVFFHETESDHHKD